MSASALEVVAIDSPPTVSDARRWLREELGGRTAPEVRDVAELVLSELVTNAVLHSPGPVRVSVSRRDGCVAIEVVDADGGELPTVHRYSEDAATGRGLQVVEACAAAWGVRGLAAGKGVWAVVADPGEPERTTRCAQRFAPGRWLLEDPTTDHELPAAPPSPPASDTVRVVLCGLPLWVYFAAQEHDDALLREFHFLGRGQGPGSVPARLLELARTTRRHFAAEGTRLRSEVEAAATHGADAVDLELAAPRHDWDLVRRLGTLLDEADAYCEQGELLTLSSPPVVRRFRTWYLAEIQAQLTGAEPSPWTGPSDPPAPDRAGVERPEERP